MSLALAAQHLQAQGRGNDTHLVHMTSGELDALQKIAKTHGGSLTINPKTGLPEAGFLSSVLPTVAGVALGAVTGDPFLAAALVGGADALMTGSLGKGLMAGLGAWGGATLAGDIAGVGSAGAADIANEGGNLAAKEFGASQAQALSDTGVASDLASSAQEYINPSNFPNLNADQIANMRSQIATAGGDETTINNVVRAAGAANSGLPITNYQNFATGLSKITSSPSNAWNFVKDNPWHVAGVVGAPIFGLFGNQAISNVAPALGSSVPSGNQLKYNSPNFQANIPTPPTPPYQTSYTNYVTNPYNPYAAKDGGLMDIEKMAKGKKVDELDLINQGVEMATKRKWIPMEPGSVGIVPVQEKYKGLDPYHEAQNVYSDILAANRIKQASGLKPIITLGSINTDPVVAASQNSILQDSQKSTSAKEGGLQDLGHYSDGGHLLKGPGDGVSDSIPATIGGKQPARLADGEFVIPARIVSELGNGSTDAGAKRLYAMMDRIKAKRAKAKDIAADTKAYQYLPA